MIEIVEREDGRFAPVRRERTGAGYSYFALAPAGVSPGMVGGYNRAAVARLARSYTTRRAARRAARRFWGDEDE